MGFGGFCIEQGFETHREEDVKVAGLLDTVTDARELVLLIQTANKNVKPSIVSLLIQVLVNVE